VLASHAFGTAGQVSTMKTTGTGTPSPASAYLQVEGAQRVQWGRAIGADEYDAPLGFRG
jgi:hypothetical protein